MDRTSSNTPEGLHYGTVIRPALSEQPVATALSTLSIVAIHGPAADSFAAKARRKFV